MPATRTSLFAGLLLLIIGQANANECLSKMPAGASALGQAKLCKSAFSGLNGQYSCQDYQASGQRFRVIYKGGLEPLAIVRLDHSGREQLIYSPRWGEHKMRCPLPAPEVISRHAQHRGLGICVDNNDKPVACSVYEHAQARQSRSWRYLVFHQHNGRSEVAHRMVAGDNRDAMEAEIAYQLGLSLLNTECCSERATAYLEHAHRLFPRVTVYRSSYLDALLQQLAVLEQDTQ